MNINRSKALLLIGALSASACVVNKVNRNDNGTGGTGNGGSGATAGSGGTGGAAGTGGTAGASGASGSGGTAGTDGGAGSGGTAGTDGGAGSGGTAGTDGGGCDDSVGNTVDCSNLAPDSSCSWISTFQQGECNNANLKPKVAEAVGNCILAQTSMELCDALNTYKCKDDALKAACPDATAATDCGTITAACTSITEADCESYLNGLTAAGRSTFVSCMTSGAFCNLYSCAEGL